MLRHSELVNTLAVVTARVLVHDLNLKVGVSKNSCIIELLFVFLQIDDLAGLYLVCI